MESDIRPLETDVQALETVHTLLDNQRRHFAISAISERDPPIALDELASAVVETETESRDDSAKTTREAGIALHHSHLPKLDDAGIVDYDTETNAITAIHTEALTLLLEFTEDRE